MDQAKKLNIGIGNTDALVQLHKTLCDMGRELLIRKNSDYTGPNDDIFHNLHDGGAYGILVRLGDKYKRLLGFEKRALIEGEGKFQVPSETVEDTAIDLINYTVLYLGYRLRERKPR